MTLNCRLALDKDPENVRALIIMGQTQLQDGMLAEAIEHLEHAISRVWYKILWACLIGHVDYKTISCGIVLCNISNILLTQFFLFKTVSIAFSSGLSHRDWGGWSVDCCITVGRFLLCTAGEAWNNFQWLWLINAWIVHVFKLRKMLQSETLEMGALNQNYCCIVRNLLLESLCEPYTLYMLPIS